MAVTRRTGDDAVIRTRPGATARLGADILWNFAAEHRSCRMARVAFTRHLHRFFPALAESPIVHLDAANVAELIRQLDARHPGLAGYLCDDDGSLRRHVNVFVNASPIRDRQGLTDALDESSSVHIMQALSGG